MQRLTNRLAVFWVPSSYCQSYYLVQAGIWLELTLPLVWTLSQQVQRAWMACQLWPFLAQPVPDLQRLAVKTKQIKADNNILILRLLTGLLPNKHLSSYFWFTNVVKEPARSTKVAYIMKSHTVTTILEGNNLHSCKSSDSSDLHC